MDGSVYFPDKEGADKLRITESYTKRPVRGPVCPVTDPTVPGKFYILQNCTELSPGPLAHFLFKAAVRKLSAPISFSIRIDTGQNQSLLEQTLEISPKSSSDSHILQGRNNSTWRNPLSEASLTPGKFPGKPLTPELSMSPFAKSGLQPCVFFLSQLKHTLSILRIKPPLATKSLKNLQPCPPPCPDGLPSLAGARLQEKALNSECLREGEDRATASGAKGAKCLGLLMYLANNNLKP